jgi:predicted CXXCH cytochrome family protein
MASPGRAGQKSLSRRKSAPKASIGGGDAPLSRRFLWIAAAITAAIVLAAGLSFQFLIGDLDDQPTTHTDAAHGATFVGSETCAGCHRTEAQLWRGSQHNLAMQHATDQSVLGDFNDASSEYHGVRSRFFRKDGKFLIETDGADGKLATFEVKYTFGLDPLQQYLVEFPDGRFQALSISWDSRPKSEGGQRWFHLYPDEKISHDDPLHWTKPNQNWNFMCAECHSTGVRRNYDAVNDRFATSFAEISVGCEACHGQGSRHIDWVRTQNSWWPFGKREDPRKGLLVRFDERRNILWPINPATGNAARNFTPAVLRKEAETCGLCHARRGGFSEDWIPGRPLSDTHFVSPMSRRLYHADGQMLDEVYNYGSFKQSKMFAAGVTCSNCHEPHGAKLRAPGDGVCLQCHAPDKYSAGTHHRHADVSPALACASCHMPTRTYMGVDRRHDHSFRVPRPDVSVSLGTPNACNDCHSDKTAEWAASAVERWHGPNRKGFQNYADAFNAAWTGRRDGAELLGRIAGDRSVAPFARASALTELSPHVSPSTFNLARVGLSDPDPMVRLGALAMLERVPASQLWPFVSPLLSDSSRGVRIRAASMLAAVATASQPAAERERFERAAAEFIAAQRLNADRPEARSALADFYARRGRATEAEAEYRAALRLDPQFTPAAVNLADFYRQRGRDEDGTGILREAISASPRDATLHHALGLALTRLKLPDEAIAAFRHASELEPASARYVYVYSVALHSAGRAYDAIAVLKKSLATHAEDRDILLALVSFSREAGDLAAALEFAEQLARIAPADRDVADLVQNLRSQLQKPGSK